MPTATIDLPAAGYRFIPAVFQYSAGVAALPGFRIERVRFAEPIALAEGWRRIAALLEAAGRPRTAFCACELRSPAPFTEAGLRTRSTTVYVGDAEGMGHLHDGQDTIRWRAAMSVPETRATRRAGVPRLLLHRAGRRRRRRSFVVAGSGEAEEGHATYREHITARGDHSPAGHARQGTLRRWARWSGAWRRSGADWHDDHGDAGRTPCTTCTPSWRR